MKIFIQLDIPDAHASYLGDDPRAALETVCYRWIRGQIVGASGAAGKFLKTARAAPSPLTLPELVSLHHLMHGQPIAYNTAKTYAQRLVAEGIMYRPHRGLYAAT